MKRLFALLLALCLCVAFAGCDKNSDSEATATPAATQTQSAEATPTATAEPTATPTPAPTQSKERIEVSAGEMIMSFDNGVEGVEFFDLSAYGYSNPEFEAVSGDKVDSGQGLQFNINNLSVHGIISAQLGQALSDFAGMAKVADYEYLRLWVSNQGDSDVSIAVVLVAKDTSKTGCLNPEKAVLITYDGEELEAITTDAADVNAVNGTGNTSLSVPAGFEGWLYYPLQDQVPWWEGSTLTVDELKAVNHLNMDIRFDDAFSAEYLVLDDICLANKG